MCMEDIRLGRKATYKVTPFQGPMPGVVLCSPNAKRVSLAFTSSATSGLTLLPGNSFNQVTGIDLAITSGLIDFDVQVHGNIVCDQWVVNTNVAGANLTVIETFQPEE